MSFTSGFFIGAIVGAYFGVFVMSLCNVAGSNDTET